MPTANLEIPADVLDATNLTLDELRVELAIHLYEESRLAIGKARELAGLSLWEFRQILGSRRIPPHYGQGELEEDLAIVHQLAG